MGPGNRSEIGRKTITPRSRVKYWNSVLEVLHAVVGANPFERSALWYLCGSYLYPLQTCGDSHMAINYWGKDAVEVRFECGHTAFIPGGHNTNHERCYACNPELAQEPLLGKCPTCESAIN